MAKLIVFCGIPGSGKTTQSKQIAMQYNAERISFDEQHCRRHEEMIPFITKSLQNEKNVVVDSLFDRIKSRTTILEAVKDFSCEKILIYMITPLDECLRRNAKRENKLPDFVLNYIYNSFELPALTEGWDEIIWRE